MTPRFHVQIPDQKWFEENIGCENACPVNTRAPQYISAILRENYNEAFDYNVTFLSKMRATEGLDMDAEIATLQQDMQAIFEKAQ